MPYIAQNRRNLLDPSINDLGDYIQDTGDLNYAITRLTLRLIIRQGATYVTASAAMGTTIFSLMEMYRRLLAEYEDSKLCRNGDIPEIAELINQIHRTKRDHIAADTEQAHG